MPSSQSKTTPSRREKSAGYLVAGQGEVSLREVAAQQLLAQRVQEQEDPGHQVPAQLLEHQLTACMMKNHSIRMHRPRRIGETLVLSSLIPNRRYV